MIELDRNGFRLDWEPAVPAPSDIQDRYTMIVECREDRLKQWILPQANKCVGKMNAFEQDCARLEETELGFIIHIKEGSTILPIIAKDLADPINTEEPTQLPPAASLANGKINYNIPIPDYISNFEIHIKCQNKEDKYNVAYRSHDFFVGEIDYTRYKLKIRYFEEELMVRIYFAAETDFFPIFKFLKPGDY